MVRAHFMASGVLAGSDMPVPIAVQAVLVGRRIIGIYSPAISAMLKTSFEHQHSKRQ